MLHDKNSLVSGGTRGIGLAIVLVLAERGANVTFTYQYSSEVAENILLGLRAKYPKQLFQCYQCDVRNADEVDILVKDMLEEFNGKIDLLVNNAGITRDVPLVSMDQEQWSDVVAVNLTGTFNLTKKLMFYMMKEKSGNVICISSASGLQGNAGQSNYSATKAGLVGFAKAVSKEVSRLGVRVNVVAPGFISTDMTAAMGDKAKSKIVEKIGMKRMGEASEVAKVVAFLASEEASYITGQVLAVDGGLTI